MQSRLARWKARILDTVTVALLLAAAALFLDARRGGAAPPPPEALERNSRVPAVEVAEADGTRSALLGARVQPGHLVLFFRTDCPVCVQQRPGWADLIARARAAGWEVTGVTNEPLTEAARQYFGSGVRVVQVAEFASLQRLRTTVVPSTLSVSRDGTVLLHHPGLLPPATTDSLVSFF